MKIVFMGTPDFAVPSLEALVYAGHEVVGVVTATDKMGGRGGKNLLESPVKKAAQRLKIPVLQPSNLKSPEFQRALGDLGAELQIVVAFRMLPQAVWNMPPLGTFNLHGSLLPKYRGAAPINWAVINGETETGATTFFIRQEIDTGDVLLQERMPIGPQDTAGDVHDTMMIRGAQLVVRTVSLIKSGKYQLHKQDDNLASPAPKIHRDTCRINWSREIDDLHDFVRGLSPYPAAWTMMNDAQLKVIRALKEKHTHRHPAGTVMTDNKTYLKVACPGGYLQIEELQLAGKRRMVTDEFLRGVSLPPELVLL